MRLFMAFAFKMEITLSKKKKKRRKFGWSIYYMSTAIFTGTYMLTLSYNVQHIPRFLRIYKV